MKFNKLFLSITACCMAASVFVSCNEDDEPILPEDKVTNGCYVLNEGNFQTNSANLAIYNPNTKERTYNVFESANGRKLGDTAQDMLIYGSKKYIAVYGSQKIEVIDNQDKSIITINKGLDDKALQPRSFTAYQGKVYVTLFDGYVACIDTTSLAIQKEVKVGRNPEGIVVANNKLYVANSGGMDYNKPIGYDKTVSVIDPVSFKVINTIEVIINPNQLVVDSENNVYLISMGNYDDILNTLQCIDSKTDKVKVIDKFNATTMAICNNTLYAIYGQYEAPKAEFIKYNTSKEEIISHNFITDGTQMGSPANTFYKIKVDTYTETVYIISATSKENADIYVFNSAGKLSDKFDAGGLSTAGVYFPFKK